MHGQAPRSLYQDTYSFGLRSGILLDTCLPSFKCCISNPWVSGGGGRRGEAPPVARGAPPWGAPGGPALLAVRPKSVQRTPICGTWSREDEGGAALLGSWCSLRCLQQFQHFRVTRTIRRHPPEYISAARLPAIARTVARTARSEIADAVIQLVACRCKAKRNEDSKATSCPARFSVDPLVN